MASAGGAVSAMGLSPVADDDPPSPAELEFMKLRRDPRRWRAWCREKLAEWVAAHPPKGRSLPNVYALPRKTYQPLPKWNGIINERK